MKWIAHRGYSEKAPENTFAAFRRAIDSGASGIEFDVHVSKDGELFVMHDEHVGRTTDGEGRIRDMSDPELATLDAGAWFSEQYRGEPVPTLEEVLDFVPPNMLLNIEIKNIPHVYPEIEKKVNQALVHRDREENTIVSSFDHACLYRLKEWNPAVNIGLLMNFRAVNLESYLRLFAPFDVHSLHPHVAVVQKNEVERWQKQGMRVFPYAVKNKTDAKEMETLGVSGVISDLPPGDL
ncbi:glycerophosphodiester phosphodiesterase [Salicibibacter halophilus]|uniref:Glycerophosphodiester phosphodiesterase n=1 Tax=Salicibibacter halophilus TaxID=2502791 RepID=A0A514LHA4_9BACI|nr:glycerophosphodiester phosphodiesterase family protein [Salicibibacter halophilus]QDI90661.1 glycerophosphodiester phosphodiesterase [Salicibibacter halophilus]